MCTKDFLPPVSPTHLPPQFHDARFSSDGNGTELLALGGSLTCRAPQSECAFSKIASNTGARSTGRRIDDTPTFRGGRLLLQRRARLGDEASILHRDDRVRGEILK
jgi:hypothetical protein